MKLNFKKSNNKPKKGNFVALHNIFPVETENSLGLIVDIKKDPLGFNYGVFEFYDKKIYYHHISTIIPLDENWEF